MSLAAAQTPTLLSAVRCGFMGATLGFGALHITARRYGPWQAIAPQKNRVSGIVTEQVGGGGGREGEIGV